METKTIDPRTIGVIDPQKKSEIEREQLIKTMLIEERKRLEAEHGVEVKKRDHFRRPFENAFLK